MPKPVKKASLQRPGYASQMGDRDAQLGKTDQSQRPTDKQGREAAMRAAKARWQKRAARP